MTRDTYAAVMSRRDEIVERSTGLSYGKYGDAPVSFDYEAMMSDLPWTFESMRGIQSRQGVGATPLIELENLTRLIRLHSPKGKGARVFVKDEAANPSGSFKDRRASMSVHHASAMGYKGVVAATSGNYGAAIASQAARAGLRAIVVQEVFDSSGRGQPEILEKGRKCEALGAEVLQTTVGPELFYMLLLTLEETGYFNASLYTPYSVAGIETLGWEIGHDCRAVVGTYPDAVLVTHAGGGNVTGVARGLKRLNAQTEVIAVSVDLGGLHMASDRDFNRKSFTTGHSGFSVPFTTWPDRADVPRNAARALRYIDRFVTVTQGEVFYATELLARVEGLERGPAGNTSLAAAIALAGAFDEHQAVVVTESEYTGAGKSPVAQLEFAASLGIEIGLGDPAESVPGKSIVIPADVTQIAVTDVDLDNLRMSYLRHALNNVGRPFTAEEEQFFASDLGTDLSRVRSLVRELD